MRKRAYYAAVVAILALLVGGGCYLALSSPQPNQSQAQSGEECAQKDDQGKCRKTLWERTTDDPVAFFTLVLAALTAVLAGAAILQMIFLVKADKTARLSADAATKAADAAVAAQRAWIDFTVEGGSNIVSNLHGVSFLAKITCKNIGNSPATKVRTYFHHVAQAANSEVNASRLAVEAAMQKADIDQAEAVGTVVFPKGEYPHMHALRVPRSVVDEVTDGTSESSLQITFGIVVRYEFAGGTGETAKVFTVWEQDTRSTSTTWIDSAPTYRPRDISVYVPNLSGSSAT